MACNITPLTNHGILSGMILYKHFPDSRCPQPDVEAPISSLSPRLRLVRDLKVVWVRGPGSWGVQGAWVSSLGKLSKFHRNQPVPGSLGIPTPQVVVIGRELFSPKCP